MIVFIRENVSFFFFFFRNFLFSYISQSRFFLILPSYRLSLSFAAPGLPHFLLSSLVSLLFLFPSFTVLAPLVGLCFLSLFLVSCLSFFITLYHSLLVSRVRTYYISSLSSPFLITLFLVLHLFTSLRMIIEQFAKNNHDVKMGRNRGRTGRIKTRELRFSRG